MGEDLSGLELEAERGGREAGRYGNGGGEGELHLICASLSYGHRGEWGSEGEIGRYESCAKLISFLRCPKKQNLASTQEGII